MITTKTKTKEKTVYILYPYLRVLTVGWRSWKFGSGSSHQGHLTQQGTSLPDSLLDLKKKVQTQMLDVDLSEKHARTASMKHPVKNNKIKKLPSDKPMLWTNIYV